ncbi:OmpA family protein [Agarivorans sp. TSD2052]|uniref:OmpA family protein n=1 Tax=Agarivorans sp. TSD2052 TaxID=2937286 RepID=UPI003531E2CB
MFCPATDPCNGSNCSVQQLKKYESCRLNFAFDSTLLSDEEKLKILKLRLGAIDLTQLCIVGHTDETGLASYNKSLGIRRAQSVKNTICGGDVDCRNRVRAISMGESEPLITDLVPMRDEINRRVYIRTDGSCP